MDMKKIKDTALGGLIKNPVFVLVLGMCPTIAVSTNVTDALGLGLSTAFVLLLSNIIISAFRKIIPDKVRLPAYITLIATIATTVLLFLEVFFPALYENIGAFIPLITVNCIILGRAESFANSNKVGYAALDALSMGIGFVAAICLLGGIRQFLNHIGFSLFNSAAGGFILLGLLMALYNFIATLIKSRKVKPRIIKRRITN